MAPRNKICRGTIGLTIGLIFELLIVGTFILFPPRLITMGVNTKFSDEEGKADIGRIPTV